MRHNALRTELAALLADTGTLRPPALRRSLREEWLYAADLPALLDEPALQEAIRRLESAGWAAEQDGNWLLLRKDAAVPPENWYDGPFGPEAACCASLLERHPERTDDGGAAARLLILAAETSGTAYEAACKRLHREWAVRLRKGEKLPAVSLRYFGR